MKKKLIAQALCLMMPVAVARFMPNASFPTVSAETITENGFTITDGTLTGYSGEETNLVIPSSVTQIGTRALANNKNITSVEIPDSVTKINESAFYNCTSLQTVSMSDTVETMGNYVFQG